MLIDKTKKYILTTKLISYIILNIIKIRELYTKFKSTKIFDKITLIKDLSKLSYDLITFNLFNIIINSSNYYNKIVKLYKIILEKIKKVNR
jgi:hypothetical protein